MKSCECVVHNFTDESALGLWKDMLLFVAGALETECEPATDDTGVHYSALSLPAASCVVKCLSSSSRDGCCGTLSTLVR